MIPIKLELTNFLSYRDTAVVDFTDIHLACVAGPNGAGKSSILDGITWALFGQSRSRSDDDLVNRIAARAGDGAEVRFTFSLEGVTYRVVRRKRAGKTGVLELQMAAGPDQWRVLSESRLRETQAAIEDLLRMNYDTFINASFLLQGQADEFTTRTDSQRKQILAELLGASQWEAYRLAAAEARRAAEGSETLLDGRLQEIDSELAEEETRQAALEAAQAAQTAVAERLRLREELLQQSRQTAAALDQLRKSVAGQQAAVARAATGLAQARETLAAREGEEAALREILAERETIEADYAAWQAANESAEKGQALANRHNRLLQQIAPLEREIGQQQTRLEAQRAALRERSRKVNEALDERAATETAIAELAAALQGLQDEQARLAGLEEELGAARTAVQQLEGQRKLRERELAALQEQAQQIEKVAAGRQALAKTTELAALQITELEEKFEVIAAQRETFAQLKAEKESLSSQQPVLFERMQTLKERLDTLQESGTEGQCPVCGQDLSAEHLQDALDTLTQDGTAQAGLYRANKKRLAALDVELPQVEKTMAEGARLEKELNAKRAEVAQAAARLEELARQEAAWAADGEARLVDAAAALADRSELDAQAARVAELSAAVAGKTAVAARLAATQQTLSERKARLGELARLIDEWAAEGQAQLTAVSEQLAHESFAAAERAALAALQDELAALGYDEAAHEAALAARTAVADAPARREALAQAATTRTALQTTLADLRAQIARQEEDLDAGRAGLAESEAQIALLAEGSAGLAELEKEVFDLRAQEIAATAKVGQAQQSVAVLDTLRQQRDTLAGEKRALALRVQRLKVLEVSCGRKGVQALLIEQALPEIEDRANDLLERLTGGDMRVRFETQRQKKSGDAMLETLDIIITDRSGQRPYENYSGGEQFRINFAIRLALSQLLTHRTGARLQTLVVDEGFGSQDPLGRQRLIEAINAVQHDFACILVITHIDELRDAFPSRIEVSKEAGGSTIKLF